MKAVRVHELGEPEVLRYEETSAPKPRTGEVLVKIEAAGVNFLDIYYRSGFHWGGHHGRALPYTPGVVRRAGDLFKWIEAGKLQVKIGRTFKLADAPSAHRELESRRSTGKILLIP